jgi:hypothetical protein
MIILKMVFLKLFVWAGLKPQHPPPHLNLPK